MSKYATGPYTVKNPEKYIGKNVPRYRSSWEFTFMNFLDNNPSVLQWTNEGIKIPYKNPLTGKNTIYIPDFLMVYVDQNQKQHSELIEIKPSKETFLESAKSPRDKAALLVNMAKWQSAQIWCKQYGLTFRVIGEQDIFRNYKK
jgi:hypothetical protein